MAPPKRRTGGRTTPKGTRPGQLPKASNPPIGTGSSTSTSTATSATVGVGASSRYTPPVARNIKESPKWVPILMMVLLGLGAACIMTRYLAFDAVGNWLVFAGLGFVLCGLYTATKWH